jgi:hypothetical protein
MAPIASLLALAAVAPPAAGVGDPLALFRSVCLADRASLPAKAFADIRFAKMPRDARVAFNQAAPLFYEKRLGREMMQPLAAKEVPNRVLARLPKKDLFLILAAPEGTAGIAASTCAVAWRGRDLERAAELVRAEFPTPARLPLPGEFKTLRVTSDDAEAAVAEFGGWTVLSVAPTSSSGK